MSIKEIRSYEFEIWMLWKYIAVQNPFIFLKTEAVSHNT